MMDNSFFNPDIFISPGYHQELGDKTWEVVKEELDTTIQPNWLEVFIRSKHPVFHPEVKYQWEPSVIECSFHLIDRGWW